MCAPAVLRWCLTCVSCCAASQAKFQLDQRVAMAGGRFRRLQEQEQAAALMVAQVAAGCAADCVSVHELIMQQPAQQAQEQAA